MIPRVGPRFPSALLIPRMTRDHFEGSAAPGVPVAGPQPVRSLHVTESPVGQQADMFDSQEVEDFLDVRQDQEQQGGTEPRAQLLDDVGVQRNRAARNGGHRHPDQAARLEQHAGVRREHHLVLAAGPPGRGEELAVNAHWAGSSHCSASAELVAHGFERIEPRLPMIDQAIRSFQAVTQIALSLPHVAGGPKNYPGDIDNRF